ncbi:MAG: protease modulator HflK, partial [Burkholderiales bacterium]|nr:protease modulator HflK [Burkholderiales bacterium]
APGVTRDRLYLDMMQSVLSTTSKVLVDQKGSNSLLYLPLDKLIAQGQVAGVAGELPRTAPAAETTVTIDAPTRARESLRGRER